MRSFNEPFAGESSIAGCASNVSIDVRVAAHSLLCRGAIERLGR